MPPFNFEKMQQAAHAALRSGVNWLEIKRLKVKHATTLKTFNNQQYISARHHGTAPPSIDIADAFNQGLLDPNALLSPLLATQIKRLTNKSVLTVWNDKTHAAMQTSPDGNHPPGAIPLNQLLSQAVNEGDTATLEWLFELKNPSENLNWDARKLLTRNLDTAHWAMMWHVDLIKGTKLHEDPERLVLDSLSPNSTFISSTWIFHVDKPGINYEQHYRKMNTLHHHAKSLMHTYFPDMPWQERWQRFVALGVPSSPVAPTTQAHSIQGLMQGTVYIAGLLSNAPLNVQKNLAAFKNSRHPEEDSNVFYDIEPKAIRHAFFEGPAPCGNVPDALDAWISIMQGTPVEEAANAWVQWHTKGHAPDDMAVELPDDAFAFQNAT